MILAAGEGTRLRPLTQNVPKPMLPVAGRPLLERIVCLLLTHGIRDIAVNLHHQPDAITAFLADGAKFGVSVTYSPERRLLGSAGGVKRMESFFAEERFFVLYGDVLTNVDLTAMHRCHIERAAALTMALYRPESLSECGVVRLGPSNRVLEFVEKPQPGQEPSSWANAGIYLVEPEILRSIPDGQPFDFGVDLFPRLLERGTAIQGYVSDALVLDIGTPERYLRAQVETELVTALRAA